MREKGLTLLNKEMSLLGAARGLVATMEVVLVGTLPAAFALVHRVGWCKKWCAQVRMRRLAVIAVIHKAIEILITPLAAVTFITFVHAQPVAPLSACCHLLLASGKNWTLASVSSYRQPTKRYVRSKESWYVSMFVTCVLLTTMVFRSPY